LPKEFKKIDINKVIEIDHKNIPKIKHSLKGAYQVEFKEQD
jgi:hypothetical protein